MIFVVCESDLPHPGCRMKTALQIRGSASHDCHRKVSCPFACPVCHSAVASPLRRLCCLAERFGIALHQQGVREIEQKAVHCSKRCNQKSATARHGENCTAAPVWDQGKPGNSERPHRQESGDIIMHLIKCEHLKLVTMDTKATYAAGSSIILRHTFPAKGTMQAIPFRERKFAPHIFWQNPHATLFVWLS